MVEKILLRKRWPRKRFLLGFGHKIYIIQSNQIGYSIHQPKMLPNSSSLMKGNQMANLKIKTEINTEDGEKVNE